jgi:molecular chaperone GrpE
MQSSPANDDEDARNAGEEQAVAEQPGAQRAPEQGTGDARSDGAELARMQDRYKRALADLDNYRKRSTREVERRLAERTEALLRDWLDVVDSVERALRMEHGETPSFQGLRAVLDQMEAILARHGAVRIGEAGERFDPERHEAIAVRASDEVPDQTVLEVARSGWAVHDRVLRPAQVVVSRREQRET